MSATAKVKSAKIRLNVLRDNCKSQTLGEAERNKDETDLWILNNTAPSSAEMSRHLIEVNNGGDRTVIKIENTWLPQNLSNQMPRSILLRDPAFRQAVIERPGERAALRIISSEDAEKLMTHPDARAENENLTMLALEKKGAQSLNSKGQATKSESNARPADTSKVSPKVFSVVTRHAEGLLNDESIMTAIKAERSQFSNADWHYLMEKGPTLRVKKYAAKRLGASKR